MPPRASKWWKIFANFIFYLYFWKHKFAKGKTAKTTGTLTMSITVGPIIKYKSRGSTCCPLASDIRNTVLLHSAENSETLRLSLPFFVVLYFINKLRTGAPLNSILEISWPDLVSQPQ